jgi:cell division septation protein DedD
MSDEGVHEIQLNGKQLVFMFMAVTVVAVVIFLCGVMVGRGVRAPRATELADAAIESPLDPTAPPASVSANGPSSTAIQDPTQDPTREYSKTLNATAPPPEPSKETSSLVQEVNATAPAAAVKTPVAEPPAASAIKTTAPKPPAPKTAASKPPKLAQVGEPAGDGFVVQVAAVKERSEADTIARRLSSKGFKSFVSSPTEGAARVYRVRVGKFNDRREAENVARRLEKEEQFKPWITR